jgi:hypothetical protein
MEKIQVGHEVRMLLYFCRLPAIHMSDQDQANRSEHAKPSSSYQIGEVSTEMPVNLVVETQSSSSPNYEVIIPGECEESGSSLPAESPIRREPQGKLKRRIQGSYGGIHRMGNCHDPAGAPGSYFSLCNRRCCISGGFVAHRASRSDLLGIGVQGPECWSIHLASVDWAWGPEENRMVLV